MVNPPGYWESFSLAKAHLFYGEPLSGRGLDAAEKWKEELAEAREELASKKRKTKERSARAVLSVNLGKCLEKIAPALPGFSYDCHAWVDHQA